MPTHQRQDLPECPSNRDFETRFTPKRGPGFFPGTEGYFRGCSSAASVDVVFFGTDFGTQRYWEHDVHDGRGERDDQTTLNRVRCLVHDAGVDPCACYLTNAILALAKIVKGRVEKNTDTHKVYRKSKHPCLFRECAKLHREWLEHHKPRVAVLMGAGHLKTYRSIWSETWPALFGTPEALWHGVSSVKAAWSHSRHQVDPASGTCVLLMYHPASWGHWRRFRPDAMSDLRSALAPR